MLLAFLLMITGAATSHLCRGDGIASTGPLQAAAPIPGAAASAGLPQATAVAADGVSGSVLCGGCRGFSASGAGVRRLGCADGRTSAPSAVRLCSESNS